MNYYFLTFWKETGRRGQFQYNAAGTNADDLQAYARTQNLPSDEIYVISLCKNGTSSLTEGEVVTSNFYNNTHQPLNLSDTTKKKFNDSINKTLQRQRDENVLSRFSADELIQEAECLEEYGEYLHAPLIGFSAETLRSYAAYLQETKEQPQEYYQSSDGWFDFYVNAKTGEKKFTLEAGDILIDRKQDDFLRSAKR